MIQYAAAFRLSCRWPRLLDAPLERGVTTGEIQRPGAIPAFFAFVIPGRAQREPGIHFNAGDVARWIPGLRPSGRIPE